MQFVCFIFFSVYAPPPLLFFYAIENDHLNKLVINARKNCSFKCRSQLVKYSGCRIFHIWKTNCSTQ